MRVGPALPANAGSAVERLPGDCRRRLNTDPVSTLQSCGQLWPRLLALFSAGSRGVVMLTVPPVGVTWFALPARRPVQGQDPGWRRAPQARGDELPGVGAVDPACGRGGEAGLAGGAPEAGPALGARARDVAAVGLGRRAAGQGRKTQLLCAWLGLVPISWRGHCIVDLLARKYDVRGTVREPQDGQQPAGCNNTFGRVAFTPGTPPRTPAGYPAWTVVLRQGALGSASVSSISWHQVKAALTARCA